MSEFEGASGLAVSDPTRLWGVTPQSIFLFLCDRAKGEKENVNFYRMVETLKTNNERDHQQLRQTLKEISRELGLTTAGDEITDLGAIALGSEEPENIIRALAIRNFPNLRQAIQDFARIDDDYMTREEFKSFFPSEETIQSLLVGSLGFAEVYPDSVEINQEVVKPLFEGISDLSSETEEWLLFAWSAEARTGIADPEFLQDIFTEVTDQEPGRIDPREIDKRVVLAHLSSSAPQYSSQDFQATVEQVKKNYLEERNTVKSLLIDFCKPNKPYDEQIEPPEVEDLSQNEVKHFLELSSVVNEANDSVLLHPGYLTSKFGCDLYKLYQAFEDLEPAGLDASVTSNNLIEIVSAPKCGYDTGVHEDYVEFLLDRYNTLEYQINQLSEADATVTPIGGPMKVELLEGLNEKLVSPVYFTYTLLNPERMGEEIMDRYAGDSRGLHLEKVKLERWQEEKPDTARSYKEMQDELLNKGLEENLDQEVVRIMTPYDDDTFREYASTLRDLARQGFEIRLLTRYTRDKYLWDRLKDNLLEPLGEHRTNVKIRTYSRYKEHEYISPGDDTDYKEEFGIHGKLQTIGDSEAGAVLLGSANFMENSFDWNPECGIYTENPLVTETAITFFDFVWELAQADPISFDQMKEVPDRDFYPSYYLR